MSATSLQLTGSHKRTATHVQGDLLEATHVDKHKLMEALDNLNARYVRGSVKVSTQGAYSGWQMKQERKSPNYTTS